ncbi:MAG: efflux RND transporter periplasmic adaptor subunit [Desulfomonilaceae bacterium]
MNSKILFWLKRQKFLLVVVVVLITIALYTIRSRSLVVEQYTVTRGTVTAKIMGTGTLEARYQTTVSAKIQGRITELTVDQNDHVKKDQLIAKLDEIELKQEVSIYTASLDASMATVERVKAELARSKAVFEQAERDYSRFESLVASKSVSQSDVEKIREKLSTAEADVIRSEAAVVEAVKLMKAAEERKRHSEAKLADTRILSPFDGLIIRRDREVGDIVVPGASIFRQISLSELWISAWVEETAISGIALGQQATIVFRSEPDRVLDGKVVRIGKMVDRETREFQVDVLVDQLPERWAIGQRAEVFINSDSNKNVLVVPNQSILRSNDETGVYRIDQKTIHWNPVKIGIRGETQSEILEGLAEGTIIVKDVQISDLGVGRRVSVK